MALSPSAIAGSFDEPLAPVPRTLHVDPVRAEIGHRLFHDVRLSANGTVSCASCHDTTRGGADSRAHSIGFHGEATGVNAPTVFNAALNFKQFWNGRANSLEEQVEAVVKNPIEMGSKWENVVAMVAHDPGYRTAFAAAYPDGVSKANIQNAIASYERTLITPDSRFDRYLRCLRARTARARYGPHKSFQFGRSWYSNGNSRTRAACLIVLGLRKSCIRGAWDAARNLDTCAQFCFTFKGLQL